MGGSSSDFTRDLIDSLLGINASHFEILNKITIIDYRYVSTILGKIKELKIFQNIQLFKFFEDLINRIKKANVSQVLDFIDLSNEFQYDQVNLSDNEEACKGFYG